MDNLIYKYKPIFYFHSKEEYFPINTSYLFNCRLLFNKSGVYQPLDKKKLTEVEVVSEKINSKILIDSVKWIASDKRYFIDFPDDNLQGIKPNNNDGNQPEIYAIVKEYENTICVYYMIIYTFNVGKTILNIEKTGDHYGDIEGLIYEYDKTNFDLKRVYFGTHTTEDGRWINFEDLKIIEGNYIETFVTLGSHGNYPTEGTVFRFGGLANDQIEKGIEWKPKIVRIYLEEEREFNIDRDGWIYFGGYFGYDGVSTILTKPWFYLHPDKIITKPAKILPRNKFNLLILLFLTLVFIVLKKVFIYFETFRDKDEEKYYFYLTIIFIVILFLIRFVVKNYI